MALYLDADFLSQNGWRLTLTGQLGLSLFVEAWGSCFHMGLPHRISMTIIRPISAVVELPIGPWKSLKYKQYKHEHNTKD